MLVWVASRNRSRFGHIYLLGTCFSWNSRGRWSKKIVSISAEFSIRFRGEFWVWEWVRTMNLEGERFSLLESIAPSYSRAADWSIRRTWLPLYKSKRRSEDEAHNELLHRCGFLFRVKREENWILSFRLPNCCWMAWGYRKSWKWPLWFWLPSGLRKPWFGG